MDEEVKVRHLIASDRAICSHGDILSSWDIPNPLVTGSSKKGVQQENFSIGPNKELGYRIFCSVDRMNSKAKNMLQGFHYPLTPKGKSTLNPPPPWHYSADFLSIEFWADPAAGAAYGAGGRTETGAAAGTPGLAVRRAAHPA